MAIQQVQVVAQRVQVVFQQVQEDQEVGKMEAQVLWEQQFFLSWVRVQEVLASMAGVQAVEFMAIWDSLLAQAFKMVQAHLFRA